MIKMTAEQIENDLSHATGTESYHKMAPMFGKIYYTDGVARMAELCGAYWLLDAIASHQVTKTVRDQEMQYWVLHVNEVPGHGRNAELICEDGNEGRLAFQKIGYTDFPLKTIKMYLQDGSLDGETPCKILMLTSEY